MKYDITYACGHTATVNLFGTAQERERKLAWMTAHECPDCYNSIGCTAVEMLYKDYKTEYPECKTKRDSYNRETKTVIVYVPVEDIPATEETTTKTEQKTEEENETMTTEEFVNAVQHTAASHFYAYTALNSGEVETLMNYIRAEREAGHSFDMSDFDIFNSNIERAAKSDDVEIKAAATYFTDAHLSVFVESYHKQLNRETAITVVNGALALACQPGAEFLANSELISAFPGYTVTVYEFCRDWNAAHPDEEPIYAPGPDIG